MQAADAVLWLAPAGELVILAAEEHKAAFNAVRDERSVHLVALIDGAAVILEGLSESQLQQLKG